MMCTVFCTLGHIVQTVGLHDKRMLAKIVRILHV